MDIQKIEELIKLLKDNDLAEIDVQYSWSERVRIVSGTHQAAQVVSNVLQPEPKVEASKEETPAEKKNDYVEIKAPIVGTFYRKPAPDEPPFVSIGDDIEAGQVVCLIEAMKIFNEIKDDVSGKVKKVLVEDSQPIEYGHPLFLIDPKG